MECKGEHEMAKANLLLHLPIVVAQRCCQVEEVVTSLREGSHHGSSFPASRD